MFTRGDWDAEFLVGYILLLDFTAELIFKLD